MDQLRLGLVEQKGSSLDGAPRVTSRGVGLSHRGTFRRGGKAECHHQRAHYRARHSPSSRRSTGARHRVPLVWGTSRGTPVLDTNSITDLQNEQACFPSQCQCTRPRPRPVRQAFARSQQGPPDARRVPLQVRIEPTGGPFDGDRPPPWGARVNGLGKASTGASSVPNSSF